MYSFWNSSLILFISLSLAFTSYLDIFLIKETKSSILFNEFIAPIFISSSSNLVLIVNSIALFGFTEVPAILLL